MKRGIVVGSEEVAALCAVFGVTDEAELNSLGVLPDNVAGGYTALNIAAVFFHFFEEATDDDLEKVYAPSISSSHW